MRYLSSSVKEKAIPRDSNLVVDVCLYVHCATGGTCIANGSILFCARTRCSGFVEEMIVHGNNGKVKLKAVWMEDEERRVEGEWRRRGR